MSTNLLLRVGLIILLLGGFTVNVKAQVSKFGKVSDEELAMRSYPQDTSAAAVMLFDVGRTYFVYGEKGFEFVFERHTRIKVLKKAGYEWANFSVPYYSSNRSKEKISGIKGYTFNLEGSDVKKDKLKSEGIFDEETTANWHQKKITMPNVKEGSVIDLTYEIRSNLLFNLREWEFQSTIPVAYSEYKAEVPEYFEYKLNQQGYLPFAESKQERGKESYLIKWGPGEVGPGGNRSPAGSENMEIETMDYFFSVKDAPALRAENYITTLRDYQSKISFELQRTKFPGRPWEEVTGDWANVTKDLLDDEDFGKQLNKRNQFKKEIAAIAAKYTTPEQKLNAIQDWVKSSVKWNGNYGIYTKSSLPKVYENKTGSAAEINLLLTAMLLEAGLDAAPVLISTREHGRINTGYSPMLNKFNYVIAHVNVDGKDYLLDATDPLMPASMLPVRCLNGEGRLIKENDKRWVALKPAVTFSKLVTTDVTLNAQGEMKGKGTESASGYNALYLRKSIKEDGEEKFAEDRAKEVGDFKLGKPVFGHIDDVNKALTITYDISGAGSGQDNDIIYLNPLLGHGESENPFKLNERMYPVDFAAPIDETYITKFTIPAGYVVDEMPKNVAVALPENSGRFTYMLQQEGNQIQIISKVSINKPVFYAEEYAYLKEFYNHIVAKHAEKIVLKIQI